MKYKNFTLTTVIAVFLSLSVIKAQTLTLKIMSYNIQQPYGTNWDGRKASLVAVINNENPDVLGSQEAVNYQRDYISTNISGYSWFGEGRDGGDAGEGSFIYYKTSKFTLDAANSGNMWLSNTPTVPSRFNGSYNRICTYVRLTDKTTNKSFYLFNIHNYMPSEYDNRLAAVKMLVQKIAARTHSSDPVYITGDFNSSEGDGVTVWMKSGSDNSIKFRDTYRDYDPTGNVTTGFGTKFDYIYCPNSSKYTTTSSHVVTSATSSSDHLPIIATVSYGEAVTVTHNIPGKIQAEAYTSMTGVILENTSDTDGGQNVGFLNIGDWMLYKVNVESSATYNVKFRTASATTAGVIDILVDNVVVKSQSFTVSGGWQTWQTITSTLDLSAGIHEIKFLIKTGDFNINWMEFAEQSNQSGFQIKAVSMNLWRRNTSWPSRVNNVASMINDQAPDVVGIQEGDEGKSPELDNLLNNYTLETGPWKEESTSILYNHNTLTLVETGVFGYSSTPDVNKSSDWGDGAVYNWLRKCNWVLLEQKSTGNRFYVYNNHLDANGLSSNPALWRSKETELMAARISARTHPEYPFIVLGDLNGDEADAAIIYLKSGSGNPVKMKDTYREILPNGPGDSFGSGKYDYILVANTSSSTTTDANIIYQNQYGHLSDHNGVYAVINFGDVSTTIFDVETKQKTTIYPNPVSNGSIFITSQSENLAYLEIYDAQGKLVLKNDNIQNNSNINILSLTQGIYFVKTENDIQKLVVQ
ncbi:MAG: carbohydrate-binding protein [Bacteroidetes bacterium]|nr:carbohydrate-binding protein [Bacteroidota bacterium]